jgi:hypothetical protein
MTGIDTKNMLKTSIMKDGMRVTAAWKLTGIGIRGIKVSNQHNIQNDG